MTTGSASVLHTKGIEPPTVHTLRDHGAPHAKFAGRAFQYTLFQASDQYNFDRWIFSEAHHALINLALQLRLLRRLRDSWRSFRFREHLLRFLPHANRFLLHLLGLRILRGDIFAAFTGSFRKLSQCQLIGRTHT
jgi:hypothetical protein